MWILTREVAASNSKSFSPHVDGEKRVDVMVILVVDGLDVTDEGK